jgi:hypothetical protein
MQDHLRSQQLPTERIFAIPPAYDQAALDDSLIAKNDRFAPPPVICNFGYKAALKISRHYRSGGIDDAQLRRKILGPTP